MTMTHQTRCLIATLCLTLAGVAGALDGQVRNAHDAREMFYLTNPDGPAGDFAAHQAEGARCDPSLAAVGVCTDIADPAVFAALRD